MSNLLDKSSLLITPTAYNVSEILSMKPSDGSGDADFSRNSGATRTTQDLLIETVTNNIPRIDYSGGVGHWLFEQETTNLVLNSTIPDTLIRLTKSDTDSVTGENNAARLNETASFGPHYAILNTSGITNGEIYTFSIFIRKGVGTNSVQIYTQSSALDTSAIINLDTFSVTLAGGDVINGSEKIQAFANDWYRVSWSGTAKATASPQIYLTLRNLGSYTGDSNTYVDYFGFTLEQQINPTSYVPTSGSATTRLADVAINSGNSSLINSNEGVLYTEFYTEADSTDKRICLSDGTSSNRVVLYITATNTLAVFVQNSNGVQVGFSSSITLGQYNKAAFKYKENDFSLFLNGTQVGTDTIGEVPSGLDRLNFANSAGTGLNFYGRVKSTAVYKEALTDAELTCLTTI